MSFFRDLRLAFHSLMHSKSLAAIVILTLALGIGANEPIFTPVRGVLLKPLVSLDDRSATVVGVLEHSVPYPAETEIIGNLVISAHHLSATMVTGRIHRMTELFGKLAPGATLDQARTELRTVYASMEKDHADAYPDNGGARGEARRSRRQES